MVIPMNSDDNTTLNIPKNDSISNIHGEFMLTEIVAIPMKKSMTNISISSSKKSHKAKDALKFRNRSGRKPTCSVEMTMADMSRRLTIRKRLHDRLTIVSDIMCVLTILGIILMIIANELTFDRVDDQDTKGSWWCKSVISISTMILLVLIGYYHYLDLKLYSNQNSLHDHRVGLTNTRLCFIVIEFLICAVHPMPRAYPYTDPPKIDVNTTDIIPHPLSYTPIDVGLGLPMFLRLYLLSRSMLFHSRLVRNASLRSFGYLNRVSIDFYFLIKTGLEQWPGRCQLVFCITTFLIGSWCLRASSYTPANNHLSMLDAMWFFIITYTTIGYGDIVPSTYCGRTIATIIGLVGLLSSALLIAVLAQKLLFTRREKYVHTFVLNTVLAKERQHHAANIIKHSIHIWILKRKSRTESFKFIHVQRKLFRSIACLQQVKQKQKNLIDNCVGFHELMAVQQNMNTEYNESIEQIMQIKNDVRKMEEKLNVMARSMTSLQTSINILLDNLSK